MKLCGTKAASSVQDTKQTSTTISKTSVKTNTAEPIYAVYTDKNG
jgi:hypothetical protein